MPARPPAPEFSDLFPMNDFLFALRFATALACGLMAGVFFAFSTFVMKGLSRLPAAAGISAMQAINSSAVHSFFLAAFLGTSAVCLLVAFSSVLQWSHPSAVYSLAGGLAFLAGGFLVTMIFNVPMNDSLATLSPTASDSAARWASYLTNWTRWNHLRTAASLAASALLIVGAFAERNDEALPRQTRSPETTSNDASK